MNKDNGQYVYMNGYYGTIYILRKHFFGEVGLENGNFYLFSLHKIGLHYIWRKGVQKAYMNGPYPFDPKVSHTKMLECL